MYRGNTVVLRCVYAFNATVYDAARKRDLEAREFIRPGMQQKFRFLATGRGKDVNYAETRPHAPE